VTLAFCCQQIVQPGGRLLVYLHSLEKRSRIKKVLVGIVNDPQHAVAVRRGEHFIEPPERQIIRRELAKSLREDRQTTNLMAIPLSSASPCRQDRIPLINAIPIPGLANALTHTSVPKHIEARWSHFS
jgi:hypothetical protein